MITAPINGAIIRSVPLVDRLAIGLSTLCVMHCLLMPILLVALPSLGASFIGSESVHLWLVYTVLPSSLFALFVGCKQHHRGVFMIIGLLGLCFLLLGISAEAMGLGHDWEPVFTVIGALSIACAHVGNFRECNRLKNCDCH